MRAKEECGLVPFDLLGNGLCYKSWCSAAVMAYAAGVGTSSVAVAVERIRFGSYCVPSRKT